MKNIVASIDDARAANDVSAPGGIQLPEQVQRDGTLFTVEVLESTAYCKGYTAVWSFQCFQEFAVYRRAPSLCECRGRKIEPIIQQQISVVCLLNSQIE